MAKNQNQNKTEISAEVQDERELAGLKAEQESDRVELTEGNDPFGYPREAGTPVDPYAENPQLPNPNTGSGVAPLGDLVHEPVQGNVREIFSREGIGEVSRADAENVLERIRAAGRYEVVEREEGEPGVFDVYQNNVLIIAGAKQEDIQRLL